MEVFLMECINPKNNSTLFFLILTFGICFSGCVADTSTPAQPVSYQDANETAIAIALNDSRIKTYLAYDGSYEVVYTGPTEFESGNVVFRATAVEIESPNDHYHIYVNVTNGTVDNIWVQPKRRLPSP
jgi:hypothetical protein